MKNPICTVIMIMTSLHNNIY